MFKKGPDGHSLCTWLRVSVSQSINNQFFQLVMVIITTTLLRMFNGFFSRTTWVSQLQKGKPFWILLKQEMMGGSGISWTICKSFAPHSRQITTAVPHHSIIMGWMLFLTPNQQCQSTEGEIGHNNHNINSNVHILLTSDVVILFAL